LSSKRELKAQFALSDGPIIFSPRQFLPLYQIETIIESFFGVLDRYPSAQLVLVGDRHVDAIYTSKLDELIRRLRLQDAVVFVPRMENRKMAGIYRVSDIVVSIPNSDSRPSSVFEAMACGVPVVVSDLAAVREIVADGETGLVAPVGDATETADAILRLLDDAPLRRRVIAQALEYVRREGDYEVQMGRVATYYADLLSKRTPPECAESADSGSSTARQ
jgi:glycosyltransferase involved in cell wall biosynthesis